MIKGLFIDVRNKSVTEIELDESISYIHHVIESDTYTGIPLQPGDVLFMDDNALFKDYNSQIGAFMFRDRIYFGHGLVTGLREHRICDVFADVETLRAMITFPTEEEMLFNYEIMHITKPRIL